MEYRLWDGTSEEIVQAESLQDAREQAEEWVRSGDWGDGTETVWVDCYIDETTIDTNGVECWRRVDHITVTIEADEPDCEDGEVHDWQTPWEILGGIRENPGCWGHGGGVICEEVCIRCGCAKTTDTWAQRPDTGEQGLTEVTYEEGKYADEVSALNTAE